VSRPLRTTPERPQGGPGSLFVFDGHNFAFRAYHALPMLNAPDGTPVNAVHGFVRMVQAARREFQPELVLAVFDTGGDGGRRRDYVQYKANRSPMPEDLAPQFSLIRRATDALGIPRIEDPDHEADDVIASYAKQAQAAGYRVVIISSDKDLMQLVDLGDETRPGIVLWDTMKSKTIGPAEVVEKFGVGPDKLGDLLALTGDTSDNIPGVPGIGPKTAAGLLTTYGDLEGVLAAAPSIPQKARRDKLVENADNARISRKLVALRDALPLPRPLAELRDPGADEADLAAFFEPLGFRQVIKEAVGTLRKTTAAAPQGELDPGEIELLRAAGYRSEPAKWRMLLAGDEPALAELAATLARSDRIALAPVVHGEDPLRATLVGLGLAAAGVEPTYVPLGHAQIDLVGGRQMSAKDVVAALAPVLREHALVVHDHKSAAHVLGANGLELRGKAFDPMLASYSLDPARMDHGLPSIAVDVLGAKLPTAEELTGKGRTRRTVAEVPFELARDFACARVEATLALGLELGRQVERAPAAIRKLLADVEAPLSWVLRRIEPRGIAIDAAVLRSQSAELATKVAEVQARVDAEAGHEVYIDSPIQLQKLLFEERGLPPTRKTKTGLTTDAKALEELALLDPIVGLILEYRSLTKLKGTYLDALPQLVRPDTGRLHTVFNQAVAATGRISSSDPNLQNIPIRTVEGRRIREAFVAPAGRKLVAMDYSQIELRILAHLSGDPNLVSAFVEGVDVHRRTAAEVFDVAETAVTDEQRRIAKAVNFGVVYGQTAFGLAQQLGIPRGKAGSYIRAYFERVPGVDKYMRELIEIASRKGYAETILGRRRRIPELRARGAAHGYGERIARNTPIQGSAADILKVAMIAVERALEHASWAQMVLTVHDELIFECDADRVGELCALVRPLMEGAVELSVPLRVDAGSGRTWAECKG
jgi:DNA polymerase-1